MNKTGELIEWSLCVGHQDLAITTYKWCLAHNAAAGCVAT